MLRSAYILVCISIGFAFAIPASAQTVQINRENKTIAISTTDEATATADTADCAPRGQGVGYTIAAAISQRENNQKSEFQHASVLLYGLQMAAASSASDPFPREFFSSIGDSDDKTISMINALAAKLGIGSPDALEPKPDLKG